MSDVIPGTGRFRREYIPVRHRVRRSLLQVIVSIIAHDQIRLIHKFCHRSRAELLHARKQSAVRILRKPVIRIHHFKITARRKVQSRVDAGAVSAVRLVYRTHDSRIVSLIFVRDLPRPVGRSVINQQNLHILPADQQGIHTALHICSRIVTRHRKCNIFHFVKPSFLFRFIICSLRYCLQLNISCRNFQSFSKESLSFSLFS